jgi:hypothetical protein
VIIGKLIPAGTGYSDEIAKQNLQLETSVSEAAALALGKSESAEVVEIVE